MKFILLVGLLYGLLLKGSSQLQGKGEGAAEENLNRQKERAIWFRGLGMYAALGDAQECNDNRIVLSIFSVPATIIKY